MTAYYIFRYTGIKHDFMCFLAVPFIILSCKCINKYNLIKICLCLFEFLNTSAYFNLYKTSPLYQFVYMQCNQAVQLALLHVIFFKQP